jgi:hypothetical protein
LVRVSLLAVAGAMLVVGVALLAGYAGVYAGAPWSGNALPLVASLALVLAGVLVIPGLVVVGALRAARSRSLGPSAPRAVPPPAGVPTLDELEDVPVPITACPECGYLGIRFPGIRDGVWPGGGETGARFVCPRCGYQGIPIEFEERDAYRAFLEDLAGGADER